MQSIAICSITNHVTKEWIRLRHNYWNKNKKRGEWGKKKEEADEQQIWLPKQKEKESEGRRREGGAGFGRRRGSSFLPGQHSLGGRRSLDRNENSSHTEEKGDREGIS
jgi:hypothetical protein